MITRCPAKNVPVVYILVYQAHNTDRTHTGVIHLPARIPGQQINTFSALEGIFDDMGADTSTLAAAQHRAAVIPLYCTVVRGELLESILLAEAQERSSVTLLY